MRVSPLRMMHAAIALCAQLGLISGASLVVVDKRGYGLAVGGRLPPPTPPRGGCGGSRYFLDPIGQSLLFGRADELVERLRDFDAYRYTRASQVGGWGSPPPRPLVGNENKIGPLGKEKGKRRKEQ